jgi:hypothetical protein
MQIFPALAGNMHTFPAAPSPGRIRWISPGHLLGPQNPEGDNVNKRHADSEAQGPGLGEGLVSAVSGCRFVPTSDPLSLQQEGNKTFKAPVKQLHSTFSDMQERGIAALHVN